MDFLKKNQKKKHFLKFYLNTVDFRGMWFSHITAECACGRYKRRELNNRTGENVTREYEAGTPIAFAKTEVSATLFEWRDNDSAIENTHLFHSKFHWNFAPIDYDLEF